MIIRATGLILVHNRPRDRHSATRRDASIARAVRNACELLRFRLLDYLVLGNGDAWTSLRHDHRVRFHSLGDDLPPPGADGRARARPKYRNPDPPHQTWSGRGKMARWLRDKLEGGGFRDRGLSGAELGRYSGLNCWHGRQIGRAGAVD